MNQNPKKKDVVITSKKQSGGSIPSPEISPPADKTKEAIILNFKKNADEGMMAAHASKPVKHDVKED